MNQAEIERAEEEHYQWYRQQDHRRLKRMATAQIQEELGVKEDEPTRCPKC